jgi:hypothetical protein
MDFQKPANGSEKRPREKSLIAFVGRREHDAFALAPCTRRLRSGAHQTATAAASALPQTADITQRGRDVRLMPKADILNSTHAAEQAFAKEPRAPLKCSHR